MAEMAALSQRFAHAGQILETSNIESILSNHINRSEVHMEDGALCKSQEIAPYSRQCTSSSEIPAKIRGCCQWLQAFGLPPSVDPDAALA
ncbi:hypothetical protein [Limnohabitans sp.]|uniref:hypothetical protein n=1 Tax=Limnohabitans sp. TaxID=1907725 RepID=UPI002AFF4FC9|nr:hypothetical protein [Limnohabitans sp.]